MNKKIRSTLGLVALLVLILIAGGAYIFFIQGNKLDEKREKLKELNANSYDPEELRLRFEDLVVRSAELDSILANRKYNIPQNLSSIKFYNFVNNLTSGYSEAAKIDIEFLEQKEDKEFYFYEYKLTGSGYFNEVYNLINSIEESKELKKINTVTLSNLVETDEEGIPEFLVAFTLNAQVYFSSDNRFAPAVSKENNLSTGILYDAFYPLVRNEIPPNIDGLLDVQGAKLLAIIPEGAFLADNSGNTYLLWEGEQVYLGYLTKIDYKNSSASFILNKGGIIEKINLTLQQGVANQEK